VSAVNAVVARIWSTACLTKCAVSLINLSIEGLCERTEYVPQLWKSENHT